MIHIYYLLLLVAVSLGSSYITKQLPTLKRVFNRLVKRFERKPREVVPTQENVYITREEYDAVLGQINQVFGDLMSRVDALETKVNKREANQRTFIRSEVKSYLEKLAK